MTVHVETSEYTNSDILYAIQSTYYVTSIKKISITRILV